MANEYPAKFKLEVLTKVHEWDNVMRASKEFDVNRQSIYRWMEQEDKIREQADQEYERVKKQEKMIRRMDQVLPDTFEEMDRRVELLKRYGTATERREKLAARVESILMTVVEMLENHPRLEDVHPKDLAKIMKDVHTVKQKLAGEPTVIIEERNRMKELVFVAVRDVFGSEAVPRLARRIENMQEAEVTIES